MILPFKNAFYIELNSILLIGRKLIDINAVPTALTQWKRDGISRMGMYKEFVDHFRNTSIKPYLEDWSVKLDNHQQCSSWNIPDFFLPELCTVKCSGTAYCEVTTNIPEVYYGMNADCVCDIWPYTEICEGTCFCK